MAAGIDLGFVGTELVTITASERERKALVRYSLPAVAGTLLGSAVMNAFAFAKGAEGSLMTAAAIAIGMAIPALIYAFTRIAAHKWQATH